MIDSFRGLNAHILVQEYIEEAKGRDIRCFVVGNEVVAAIERQARPTALVFTREDLDRQFKRI